MQLGNPFGIDVRASDHIHRVINDGTCSRCRQPVPDDSVPLMLWLGADGEDMLIYCQGCVGTYEESFF
jgi:hypothetical protein